MYTSHSCLLPDGVDGFLGVDELFGVDGLLGAVEAVLALLVLLEALLDGLLVGADDEGTDNCFVNFDVGYASASVSSASCVICFLIFFLRFFFSSSDIRDSCALDIRRD